jgi:hypothetical protein
MWSAIVKCNGEKIEVNNKTRKGDVEGDYEILEFKYDVQMAIDLGGELFNFIRGEVEYFTNHKQLEFINSTPIVKTNEYEDYEPEEENEEEGFIDFTFEDIWESEEEFTSLTSSMLEKIKKSEKKYRQAV